MKMILRAHLISPRPLFWLLICQALCFHGWLGSAHGAEKKSANAIDVKVIQGELTLDVRNQPLAQVLREIAAQANLQLTLRGDLSAPVTQSFAGVPLDDAIRQLAREYSFALIYAGATGEREAVNLTGLWIIGNAGSSESFAELKIVPALPGASEQANDTPARQTAQAPALTSTGEIQALAEEARAGNRAAIAHLGDIVASEPNADMRTQAVAALATLKGKEVEAVLAKALNDDDASVRVRAVRGLRIQGTAAATRSVSSVMLTDADPQVRLAAIRALSSLPDRASLPLLERASRDANGAIRDSASRALAWWRSQLH